MNPIIIPALDLIDGQVVRLYQGDYQQSTTYTNDPVAKFKEYTDDGATYLHLVDLTGAKNPADRQLDLIKAIVESTPCPIQVGGGIRSEQDVSDLLRLGVARVVVGSMAVKEAETVKGWFDKFGADNIVLALDVNIQDSQNLVAVSGWQETSDITLESVVHEYQSVGLIHVLCTDISKDGTLQGSNVALYQHLSREFPTLKIQASGGIGGLSDIIALKDSGVYGVIVGRALLEGKFDVRQAMSALN